MPDVPTGLTVLGFALRLRRAARVKARLAGMPPTPSEMTHLTPNPEAASYCEKANHFGGRFMSEDKHFLRGAVAGLLGGLVASWVMNEFMAGPGQKTSASGAKYQRE